MKKFNIAVLILLFGMAMMSDGCKKSKEDTCPNLEDNVIAASNAFGSNPSQATCEDLYNAIQDWYKGCDAIPPSLRQQYDAMLNSLDCSAFKK
jgi:hypothetical protein